MSQDIRNLPLTEETVLKLAKGTATQRRMQQIVPHKLNSREWAAFEQAKEDGFVVTRVWQQRTAAPRYNLDNVWFLWCEATGRPYIRIRPKRKYAYVDYDLIASPKTLSSDCVESMRVLCQERNRFRYGFIPGQVSGEFEVPVGDAPEVARRVLELIQADWMETVSV